MSDEEKKPPPPFDLTPGADAALQAIQNHHVLRTQGARFNARLGNVSFRVDPPRVPAPAPDVDFGTLTAAAVFTPVGKTSEGVLVRAVTLPLAEIIARIHADPTLMYVVDPRKWEEIIAATYEASGFFDRVTLTPRSGDYGRDVIAEKDGFGSVRLIESVKRYAPGHVVTLAEVHSLLGAMDGDRAASKGILSTTSTFAPLLMQAPRIADLVPTRLELVDGDALVRRLREYTKKR